MSLLGPVSDFVKNRVDPYLENLVRSETFPAELVKDMAELGLFGMNIPEAYGGLEVGRQEILQVMEELARGWLCLPSIVGSHLRIAPYFLAAGTIQQQQDFLPRLASGGELWAHAYNERRVSHWRELSTCLSRSTWTLSGCKDWVTNAAQAHRVLVLARTDWDTLAAVVVDPRRPEVKCEELPRIGMRGASLCRLEILGLEVDPERDLVGGPAADMAPQLAAARGPKALAFASRAVGAARRVVELCQELIASRTRLQPLHPVAAQRWGRVILDFQACKAVYQSARVAATEPDVAKVFCAEALARMVENSMHLCGGDGFAGPGRLLAQLSSDVLALQLAGTPNDVLVSRLSL